MTMYTITYQKSVRSLQVFAVERFAASVADAWQSAERAIKELYPAAHILSVSTVSDQDRELVLNGYGLVR